MSLGLFFSCYWIAAVFFIQTYNFQPTDILIGVAIDFQPGGDGSQVIFLTEEAIKAVNNDPTILPNHTLKTYYGNSLCSDTGGVKVGVEFATQYPEMVAWLGADCSGDSIPIAQLGKVFITPQISYGATNPTLSDKSRYPYFMRTVGSDVYQANAIIAACLRYGWKRVVTLNSQEELHSLIMDAFIRGARSRGIEVLASASFQGNSQSEPRSQLQTLRNTGATIIIMSCNRRDAQTVVRLASELQMVGKPYLWVGTDAWIDSGFPFPTFDNVTDAGCVPCELNAGNASNYPLWVQGFFGFVPNPEFNALGLALQDALLVNLTITLGDVFVYGFFAYDGLKTIARALHYMLYDNISIPYSTPASDDFRAALYDSMRDQEFTGITGDVVFDEFGDRVVPYLIFSLGWLNNFTSFGIIRVHTWDPITTNWTDSLTTNITWPGNETVIVPSDNFPFRIITIENGLMIAFVSIAAVAMAFGVILCIGLAVFWTHERITAATPIFLAIILFGTLLAESIVFVISVFPTAATCVIPHWFGHTAFTLVFSCLFFKTFRIWRIWQFKWGADLKKARSKKIKDNFGLKQGHLLLMVVLCTLAMLSYLAIFTGVDRPKVVYVPDAANPLNLIVQCQATFAWVIPMYIVEIIALLMTVVICWQIRKVELLRFNESSHISICIYALILIGIILIPQVLFLTKDINTLFVLESVCIIIAALTIQVAIFLPKFKAIILKEKSDVTSYNAGSRTATEKSASTRSDL